MKTKIACIALLSPVLVFLVLSRGRSGRAAYNAAHDISANAVIQKSDLGFSHSRENLWQSLWAKRIYDYREIVGHKALHPIQQGDTINRGDID
jgi:hypothetical protein